ncbi:hypothetical protein LEP1GSC088_1997 [Leptospira interrogans str. L1207]|nr:hypothetical protein LEP1GSC088_1997 [Leptospira interrogans str. L1207]
MKIVGTIINTKRIIAQSNFYTKPPFCDHHQNLNPALT